MRTCNRSFSPLPHLFLFFCFTESFVIVFPLLCSHKHTDTLQCVCDGLLRPLFADCFLFFFIYFKTHTPLFFLFLFLSALPSGDDERRQSPRPSHAGSRWPRNAAQSVRQPCARAYPIHRYFLFFLSIAFTILSIDKFWMLQRSRRIQDPSKGTGLVAVRWATEMPRLDGTLSRPGREITITVEDLGILIMTNRPVEGEVLEAEGREPVAASRRESSWPCLTTIPPPCRPIRTLVRRNCPSAKDSSSRCDDPLGLPMDLG